jgi:hypothetical protein
VISLSPTEDEIHEDARLRNMITTEFSAAAPVSQQPQPTPQPQPQWQHLQGPQPQQPWQHLQGPQPQSPQQPQTPAQPLPTRRSSTDALVGRNRIPRHRDGRH